MSYKASAWAVEQKVGDPLAKLLLLTLAESADIDHQTCWPAVATLARRMEASTRTVRYKLKLLEDRGLIRISYRRRPNGSQRSNSYVLNVAASTLHHMHPPPASSAALEPVSRNQSGTLHSKETPDGVCVPFRDPMKPRTPKLRKPTRREIQQFYRDHPECQWQIEASIPDRLTAAGWKIRGRPVWNWQALLLDTPEPNYG